METMIYTVESVIGLILILALFYIINRFLKRIELNRKLKKLINTQEQYDFLLCDVRDQSEYDKAHIPGAVSFPLNELTYLPVEDMFLTIVVYGETKADSDRAAEYLSTNGYFNVISYGKFKHWKGALQERAGFHISKFPSKKESKYDIQETDISCI